MLNKIKRLMIAIGYKIKYGKKIELKTAPTWEWGAKIRIKSGYAKIGRGFRIRTGSYIAVVTDGHLLIGDDVFLNRNCTIVCQDSVTIGTHCAFGPNVIIYDHDHNFGESGIEEGYKTAPVVIESNCWIGANVTILRGTHIGEGCVIGAGSVIKGDIPPHSLVTSDRKIIIRPVRKREETNRLV